MNREFYNTKSPLSGEGQASVASLLEAAGQVAFEKLLDRQSKVDPVDLYDPERARIGKPDVLRSHRNQPAHNDKRVLGRYQHARHPIERGVYVAAAQRLM